MPKGGVTEISAANKAEEFRRWGSVRIPGTLCSSPWRVKWGWEGPDSLHSNKLSLCSMCLSAPGNRLTLWTWVSRRFPVRDPTVPSFTTRKTVEETAAWLCGYSCPGAEQGRPAPTPVCPLTLFLYWQLDLKVLFSLSPPEPPLRLRYMALTVSTR